MIPWPTRHGADALRRPAGVPHGRSDPGRENGKACHRCGGVEKTLGVVGTGRIGKGVIRRAAGFEMNVLAYDATPTRISSPPTAGNMWIWTRFSGSLILSRSTVLSTKRPGTWWTGRAWRR